MKTDLATKLQNFRFLGGLCRRKPAFFGRLVAGFVRARVLGRRRLRLMDIALDYRCNMRCRHCSATAMARPDTPPLTVAEYRRIAAMLRREGCLIFHFTGGEPLLRPDLEEIIAAFAPGRCGISIQSNGLLATRERLRALRRAGADIFNVSIDSGIPAEHDDFRRSPGAFAAAREAVRNALATGYRVNVSTCISHTNLHSEGLRRLLALTRELGVWCYFNLAVPAGNWRDCGEFMLTREDQAGMRRLLREHPHCRVDLHSNWHRVGCGAVKEKGYLTPYGDFLPCPFIQVSLGNLREEGIGVIRRRALRVPEFDAYCPRCLAAEEEDFIRKTPCYSGWEGQLPIPYGEVEWLAERMGNAAGEGRREAAGR